MQEKIDGPKGMRMVHHEPHHQNITCPVSRTAEIICGKWTLLIIRDLAYETQRFCQLERSLHGISPKTLSDRLHGLEREGIVRRQTFGEVPPRVEYSLTEKGRDLAEVIEVMRAFGTRWLADKGPCHGDAATVDAPVADKAAAVAK
jgi:DNA-binding HxlR family transcriptional regulator